MRQVQQQQQQQQQEFGAKQQQAPSSATIGGNPFAAFEHFRATNGGSGLIEQKVRTQCLMGWA
jgi:hypothetical protein